MKKKKRLIPLPQTRVLGHSEDLSLYERESRAAEATLAEERKKKKRTSRMEVGDSEDSNQEE
jgi:hypothetical protein